MVTPREKLIAALSVSDPVKKQMTVAAVICGIFRDIGDLAVMVGGSAVELYTVGQYTTVDLDFIVKDTKKINPVMEPLGFQNKGGTWVLPDDPSIIVEYPLGPLAGSYDKVQPIRVRDGEVVDVIGLEDIIVDRTAASKFWRDGSDLWAKSMALSRYDEIDWEYCFEAARGLECEAETVALKAWVEDEQRKQS